MFSLPFSFSHVQLIRLLQSCETQVEELLSDLAKNSEVVVPDSKAWTLCRYNPPFSVPFLNTNEIHVPVMYSPASQ